MLIIDDISNVSTNVLACLSELFAMARECPSKPFGSLPVLFVGDLNQKGSCGGALMTADIMKYVQGQLEEPDSSAVLDDSEADYCSDKSQGCCILIQSCWFELTEAERSKDDLQNNLLHHMYIGKAVTLEHLKRYDFYNANTVKKANSAETKLWLEAPVICKKNRERYTINFLEHFFLLAQLVMYLYVGNLLTPNGKDVLLMITTLKKL